MESYKLIDTEEENIIVLNAEKKIVSLKREVIRIEKEETIDRFINEERGNKEENEITIDEKS